METGVHTEHLLEASRLRREGAGACGTGLSLARRACYKAGGPESPAGVGNVEVIICGSVGEKRRM